jgi:hypothetical protein
MKGQASLSYLQAALAVLEMSGCPMTAREITDEAISRGLLVSFGKTPVRSMETVLYRHALDESGRRIIRLFETGAGRARRGSVRWVLKSPD